MTPHDFNRQLKEMVVAETNGALRSLSPDACDIFHTAFEGYIVDLLRHCYNVRGQEPIRNKTPLKSICQRHWIQGVQEYTGSFPTELQSSDDTIFDSEDANMVC